MKKGILLLSLFCALGTFAQQRVGVEFFTRLEDFSKAIHYQKVVQSHFLIGAGAFFQGRYFTYKTLSEDSTHNPFGFVDSRIEANGTTYHIADYNVRSNFAIGGQIMTGWFHDFSPYQSIRVNLNFRFGYAKSLVRVMYLNENNTYPLITTMVGYHSFQAISPEVYHTLRKTGKWAFYYGVRLPFYFSLFKKSYSPENSFDIYKKPKLELVIGVTRQIGKSREERERLKKASKKSI